MTDSNAQEHEYAEMDQQAVCQFVRRQLQEFPLTSNEACAICDANNGAILFPDQACWVGVGPNVQDSGRLNGLDSKWDVDSQDLTKRILSAPVAVQFSLAWACAQFWRHTELPNDEALKVAGFTVKGGDDA